MRPWITVVSSTAAALASAAALVRPGLTMTPRAAILPSLMPLLPTMTVTALAVYALCAILLTSGSLIAAVLRLRRHLVRNPAHRGPARPPWTAAFEESGLQRLIPPPAAAQPRPAPADGSVVLQEWFQPREARREVARFYYIGAARTHFFSALIVLAAGVVLGAAQQHSPLPILPGPIPTIPAALAVAGLALLAVLARIAVDVTTEPLIETISRLPAEPTTVWLLRRTTELLEAALATNHVGQAAASAPAPQIPDQLVSVLEQGSQSHHALLDAIERLSKTTDGLATTTKSSIEALEAAFRATEFRQQAGGQDSGVDPLAMAQLRDAVSGLTAVLERARSAPSAAIESAADADPNVIHKERQPDLAQELRKLLQDIETAP